MDALNDYIDNGVLNPIIYIKKSILFQTIDEAKYLSSKERKYLKENPPKFFFGEKIIINDRISGDWIITKEEIKQTL